MQEQVQGKSRGEGCTRQLDVVDFLHFPADAVSAASPFSKANNVQTPCFSFKTAILILLELSPFTNKALATAVSAGDMILLLSRYYSCGSPLA
jgi:hypothetical protein